MQIYANIVNRLGLYGGGGCVIGIAPAQPVGGRIMDIAPAPAPPNVPKFSFLYYCRVV